MFTLTMAVRELRASWARLLFFFVCLAVGVGSIVTLRSVIQAVRGVMTSETRTMLGGDVAISSNRAWEPSVLQVIDERVGAATVFARTQTIETITMARPADSSKPLARLVEMVGVQPSYPLYGRFELEGGQPYTFDLLRQGGALVREELLAQLGVRVGDAILIGDASLTIRGVIHAEPGRRAGGFSIGSRVFVSEEDFRKTGLLGFGSRASFRLLLRVPDAQADPIAKDLNARLRAQFVRAQSFKSAEDHAADNFSRAEDYLSLVGLVVVVLGGVGVWSVVRVFMQQKLRAIAVLKCVGATTRLILLTYLVQIVAMSLVGSALGVGLGALALAWVQPMIDQLAGITVGYSLSGSAALQGAGVGLLVSVLFAIVPLLDIRHVRPSTLLRPMEAPAGPRIDWLRLAAMAAVGVALVGVAAWQAGSLRVGAIMSIGFAAVVLVLNLAGTVIVRTLAPLEKSPWFPLRYAARRIGRPGNQVRAILLAVGLGTFLVVGARMVQDTILGEFQLARTPDSPDLFLIDVQEDQVASLRSLLSRPELGVIGTPQVIPVLRARVSAVTGASAARNPDDVRRRGLGREFTVTYRAALEPNERVTAGTFWPSSPSQAPEVSVEQGVFDHAGLAIGDVVSFNVLGRVIEARVTSVRSVNWVDARSGGFVFVFRPGPLDAAPHTYIAPLRGPATAAERGRLQRAVVDAFPNVSMVDVREVLVTAERILSLVTLAVTVVGSLVLVTGTLILIGAVAMTRFQRVYEAAILKTVGATSGFIATLLAAEYGLLGTVAGGIGSAGGLVLSWALSRYALKVAWTPSPGLAAFGVLASFVLVTVVGLAASLDVLRRKPLASLRGE